MSDIMETLPTPESLDRHAAAAPEAEHLADVKAIEARKEAGAKNEAQMRDVLSAVQIKSSEIEEEDREENALAEKLAESAEMELATQGELDDPQAARQLTVDMNLVPLTVTGDGPGYYYDFNPYHSWQRWYTHNEGGVTEGKVHCDKDARKMHTYSLARGTGPGFTDDNYVTCWTKLYFAFWPRRNGHVRAYVPYTARGWYDIYANDKWHNSKSAKIDVDVEVQLLQNTWGGLVEDDLFNLKGDNIKRKDRIDVSRSLYSGGMPIGADKWVIAEVTLKAYAYASGSGSLARVSFWETDYLRVPYVRFDFS